MSMLATAAVAPVTEAAYCCPRVGSLWSRRRARPRASKRPAGHPTAALPERRMTGCSWMTLDGLLRVLPTSHALSGNCPETRIS
jgi:hypothetical protein